MTVADSREIQACAVRATRLDQQGNPQTGATASWAHNLFAKLDVNPQIEAGNQFLQKNACGLIAINYRDDDMVKWWDLELELQYPDPEASELLEAGSLITAGGITRGYAFPRLLLQNTGPVALELWAKRLINNIQATDFPWYRWVLPYCKLRPGNNTFDNNPKTFLFSGFAQENPNWSAANVGKGPYSDWTVDETSAGTALPAIVSSLQYIESVKLPTTLAPGYQTMS